MIKKAVFLLLLLMLIPAASAKSMGSDKEVYEGSSAGSLSTEEDFSALVKTGSNITVYEYDQFGTLTITVGNAPVLLKNGEAETLTYSTVGAGNQTITITDRDDPTVTGGILLSYADHVSIIGSTGLTNVIMSWIVTPETPEDQGLFNIRLIATAFVFIVIMFMIVSNKRE